MIFSKLIKKTLSREVEGLGPMKPGNRPRKAMVPIPAGFMILTDEELCI
jgi:hypothetical protein